MREQSAATVSAINTPSRALLGRFVSRGKKKVHTDSVQHPAI